MNSCIGRITATNINRHSIADHSSVTNIEVICSSLNTFQDRGTYTSQTAFDKRTLKRIQDLEQLEENKKQTLYDLIDTYIRDAKARSAYSL